jgi:hypothetical protein
MQPMPPVHFRALETAAGQAGAEQGDALLDLLDVNMVHKYLDPVNVDITWRKGGGLPPDGVADPSSRGGPCPALPEQLSKSCDSFMPRLQQHAFSQHIQSFDVRIHPPASHTRAEPP